MDMLRTTLECALLYRNLGLSVIPCGRDKKPLLSWLEFQGRLADEDEIREWWNLYPKANVGIVTGAVSGGLCAIDIDAVEIGMKALQGVMDVPEGPASQTGSGGQHLFFRASGLTPPNNARSIPGCDFRGEGGFIVLPPSVSDSGPYVWLPGMALGEIPLPILPDAYLEAIRGATGSRTTQEAALQPINTKGRRNDQTFSLAYNSLKGGMPAQDALAHVLLFASNCIPPLNEKEARRSFDSALQRVGNVFGRIPDKTPVSVSEIVENLIGDGYEEGTFRGTWLYEEVREKMGVQRGTKGYGEVRDAVKQKLRRMKKEGIIEPAGRMAGEYRKINSEVEEIDFMTAPTDKVDVVWPFELESLVDTYSKNIVVVSGTPDSGKTAFLLGFTEMNMDDHKIHYFSSEMAATEMRARLEKFDRPLESWNFTAVERAGQFADVIKPDDINVIDFLELNSDFFLVGALIKNIFDKLNKGIAVIALQQAPGAEYGRGGVGSAEKARLYVSLSRNKDGQNQIKVVKGKNWHDPRVNPNGRFKRFSLIGGCKFVIHDHEWLRDY